MKRLPPSMQEKHRYLKFKVEGEQKSLGEIVDAFWKSTHKYLGTKTVSKAKLRIIGNKFDKEKQKGVIKVGKDKEDDLRAALTINNGFKDETFLTIIKTSGTIKKLEK